LPLGKSGQPTSGQSADQARRRAAESDDPIQGDRFEYMVAQSPRQPDLPATDRQLPGDQHDEGCKHGRRSRMSPTGLKAITPSSSNSEPKAPLPNRAASVMAVTCSS
jgi:hypothetical protein